MTVAPPYDPVTTLLGILDLEKIEENLFRGTGAGGETSKRIFGGHVISQALRAAYDTVEGRACHSLHAYFLRAGDPSLPVVYAVDRSRDGGSFTTRRVVALQKGEQILVLAASFHSEETGHDHQHAMPATLPIGAPGGAFADIPDPDTLPTREERIAELWDRMTPPLRAAYDRPSPIDMREVFARDPLAPQVEDDRNAIWFRLRRPVDATPAQQHCLLAYGSDLYLLGSALRPMGQSFWTGQIMTASLDHALWFHRPLNFSDWHLYVMDSPSASGALGFNRGSIFAQDGRLVASSAQEGLTRPVAPRT